MTYYFGDAGGIDNDYCRRTDGEHDREPRHQAHIEGRLMGGLGDDRLEDRVDSMRQREPDYRGARG